MITKTLVFNKIQKTPGFIESQINKELDGKTLKFATQNESQMKGKFIVTLFLDEKKSSTKVKVFKEQMIDKMDSAINEFLNDVDFKYCTQSFVGSNVYSLVYYAEKKNAE